MENITLIDVKVQVATDNTFTDIVFSDFVEYGTTTDVFHNLKNFTRYYWRAKRINPIDGSESPWSDYCTFLTKGVDYIFDHIADKYSWIDQRDYRHYMGLEDCWMIGMNLNDIREDVNYPNPNATCSFIGNDLTNLKNRNV